MKSKFLTTFFSLLLLAIVACNQNNAINTQIEDAPAKLNISDTSEIKRAHISFETDEHNFGDVMQGEKVFYSFNFTNTGEADLVISMARGSCGCTVPTYPRKPIKPGQKGKIDVVFDSENLVGITEKNVTVLSNSYPKGIEMLTIRVNVVDPSLNNINY